MSMRLNVAARFPVAVGLKVTLIVQLDPAVRLATQLVVWAKSPLLVPVIAMPLIVRLASPVLLRVTPWAGLVVPTV